MNRPRRNRYRASGVLLVAAALLAAVGVLPSFAVAKDGNDDHIPDRWEKRHNLSLQVKQTHRDQDRDHMSNRAEFLAGDNPRDRDSDDDGVMDGNENAGTIASFDATTGKLTIDLFGGDSISGVVTENTRIKCEDEQESGVARASHDGVEPGDDNGGGAEPGDDHGGNSGPGSGDSGTGSSNSGPGSTNSGPGQDGNDDDNADANCTTADLTQGAVVEEAELEIEHGVATFAEVELAG